MKSLNIKNAQIVNFNEQSNLDYQVYLKENNFYNEKYLGKDMVYVASLINNIDITFDYLVTLNSKVDIDLNYQVIAKLLITDSSMNKKYFEKDFNLTNKEKLNLKNNLSQTINKKISIDYNYYNSIANTFKTNYGINCESMLMVYMNIEKESSNDNIKLLNNNTKLSINIPLSEKSVDIALDYKDIDKQSYVTKNNGLSIVNIYFFIGGLIVIVFSSLFLVRFINLLLKLKNRRNKYDKYIANILKNYDRMIIETKNMPSFDNKTIIKVKDFLELIDVRDNLKIPILYCQISNHNKCAFYIINGDIIYLKIIKAIDLEVKDD